jgi:predicted RNase H-like nuclease (RuvC/YqgF family)
MNFNFTEWMTPALAAIGTFILGYLSRRWLTPSEKSKQEADIFKVYADIIDSHTKTITQLQAHVNSLSSGQTILESRITELETENEKLKKENKELKSLVHKNERHRIENRK